MVCEHCMYANNPDHICVATVPIFKQLSQSQKQEISKTVMQTTFKNREFILRAGDPSNHLYIIHHGRVKIYRLSETGREQLIRILIAGDFIGELTLFNEVDSPNFAQALEDTEVCAIARSDMQDLMTKYPSISLKVLEEMSMRLHQTEMLFEGVNAEDAEQRVASYLIDYAKQKGIGPHSPPTPMILPASKQDLASLIGTSRETLSRKLSAFQRRGWIKQFKQRTILILQYEPLLKCAQGDDIVA